MGEPRPRVGVVGAGLAGMSAGHRLAHAGVPVTLYDKARGPGGRMSTRREGSYVFDHGAQYFTARGQAFSAAVAAWQQRGVVARWDPRLVVLEDGATLHKASTTTRYVGTPNMNAVVSVLAAPLDVHFDVHVAALRRESTTWVFLDASGGAIGRYEIALLAVPPEQARPLLTDVPNVADALPRSVMLPCWAVMLAFESAPDLPFDAAFVHSSPLAWVARNASKPGRPADECWVVHASVEWTAEHLDEQPEQICKILFDSFTHAAGRRLPPPTFIKAHRWRLAKASVPLGRDSVWRSDSQVGFCGDWCRGDRVEDAYVSGLSLAANVRAYLVA